MNRLRWLTPVLMAATCLDASSAFARTPENSTSLAGPHLLLAQKKPRPSKPRPQGKGVRPMFDEAMKLYDAGKYPQALTAFEAVLKRYPGHEPAQVQIAKTLYRLDRTKEAYAVFARIAPQHLDPETSYEYGWSFYTMKQWEGALYSFQRVPKGHALFDLANYYGGICAIKLRKYDEASEMLDKAVVLPDKLAKSRLLYIKHVQALRLMQQKNSLAKERNFERGRLKEKNKARERDKAAAQLQDDEPKSYQHKGRQEIDKTAGVSYGIEQQYFDHHGLKETSYAARIASFNLASGFLVPMPIKMSKDRQAAFGLQLGLGADDRIIKGEDQRVIIEERNQDFSRLVEKDLGDLDEKIGRASAGMWVEFPLPEDFWLSIGGDISFLYYDFERGKRIGTRGGALVLGGIASQIDFDAKLSYTELFDVETQADMAEIRGTAAVSRALIEKLTGEFKVTHKIFDYLDETAQIDGPDSATSGELSATQAMPFGVELSLAGAYEFQTNYTFHAVPTYGQLAGNAQVMTGKAGLKAEPFPWISLAVQQLISRATWTPNNPEARDTFELTAPDYVESLTATATLNLAF